LTPREATGGVHDGGQKNSQPATPRRVTVPRVCRYFHRVAPVLPSTANTLPNADFDVEHAVDRDRGALVGPRGDPALDAVEPRAAQVVNVVVADPAERAVVLIAVVAADLGKVAGGRRGAAARRRRAAGRGIALRERGTDEVGHQHGADRGGRGSLEQ
jgi:hypothetical protein